VVIRRRVDANVMTFWRPRHWLLSAANCVGDDNGRGFPETVLEDRDLAIDVGLRLRAEPGTHVQLFACFTAPENTICQKNEVVS
jgi:hypothetical protein